MTDPVCRHCRISLEPSDLEDFDGDPLWKHAGSTHVCPHHPETIAQPADLRWENVWASVEFDGMFHYHFRIYVYHNEKRFERNYIVSKDELFNFYGDLYSLVLNEMVRQIDAWMYDDWRSSLVLSAKKLDEERLTAMALAATERRLREGLMTNDEIVKALLG